MRTTAIILAMLAATATTPALAATNCAAMSVKLTAAVRTADAAQVARTGKAPGTTAANVTYVLAEPGWRVVWATPPNAEFGVFFFRVTGTSYRFVDVWGGVMDDRGFTLRWAQKLKGGGPSARMRTCFANALAEGK